MLGHQQVEQQLDEIASGKKFINCISSFGDDLVFMLSFPPLSLRTYANFIYARCFAECRALGLMDSSEIEELIDKLGFYPGEDKSRLDSCNKQILAQKEILLRSDFAPRQVERVEVVVNNINNEIAEIESRKLVYLAHSIERKALEAKIMYFLPHCVANSAGEKVWGTEEEFSYYSDVYLRTQLLSAFISFFSGRSIANIRNLARHNLWRAKYITAVKTSQPLFSVSISDYTSDMLGLLYWSHFYQSVYEMYEDPPSEIVVEHDFALDVYMENWSKKQARKKFESQSELSGSKLSAFSHNEVLVMKENPAFDEIEYTPRREKRSTKPSLIYDAGRKR